MTTLTTKSLLKILMLVVGQIKSWVMGNGGEENHPSPLSIFQKFPHGRLSVVKL